MLNIKETLVVEGKGDRDAIRRVASCNFIITRGIHLSFATLSEIEQAAGTCGIIVFTDPDGPGMSIRRKIDAFLEKRKDKGTETYIVKHAHLSRKECMKNGDLGVENASDESLIEALKELRTEAQDSKEDEYSHGDLAAFGLSGHGSAELRRAICDELRIGCSNVKTLIKKLNYYGIKRGDLQAAIEKWRKT